MKTWIQLTELVEPKWFNFISLDFDTHALCCTILIGRNYNNTMVEMYDSKYNKWTQSEIPFSAGNSIQPRGEGVCSTEKYYELNNVHDEESINIVTLDVQ